MLLDCGAAITCKAGFVDGAFNLKLCALVLEGNSNCCPLLDIEILGGIRNG